MSDQSESPINLLVDRLVVDNPGDDHDDPSKELAHLLDGENAEHIRSLLRAFSSPINKQNILLVAAPAPKQWCYMIVTPPPSLKSVGIRNEVVDSRGKKVTVYQWLVKFGDGDPKADADATGRYKTHNPYYRVEVNKTGRKATDIEREVFRRRQFESSGQSKEWYVVWDSEKTTVLRQRRLKFLLDNWSKVDLQKADKLDKLIKYIKIEIPEKCNKAV